MLGIGTSELIVLLGVALMVFGPQKLPELARLLAKATKMFNDASREIQRQLEMSEREIREAERKATIADKPKSEFDLDSDPYEETYSDGSEEYDYETGHDGSPEPGQEVSEAETVDGSEHYDIKSGNGNDETSKPPNIMDDPDKVGDANRLSRETTD